MIAAFLANVSSEMWVVLVTGLFGGASVLGVFIKLVFSQREQASAAYINGHTTATEASKLELAALEDKFEAEMADMEQRHHRDMNEVRVQMRLLREAIVQILPLVAQDKLQEAMMILANLNLAPTRHDDPPLTSVID